MEVYAVTTEGAGLKNLQTVCINLGMELFAYLLSQLLFFKLKMSIFNLICNPFLFLLKRIKINIKIKALIFFESNFTRIK